MKLSGARLCAMHPGASVGIQVSVKTRMSNAPSCILSFIRDKLKEKALLASDLELSKPNFIFEKITAWRRLLEKCLKNLF